MIIPARNEAPRIGDLLDYLERHRGGYGLERIVVDGASTDATAAAASGCGARVIRCRRAHRARQMNLGAASARGDVLYFLHADCRPPRDYARSIAAACRAGIDCGCFRIAFRSPPPLLRVHSWLVRLPFGCVRFGDQSLFVRRRAFAAAGGFDESMSIFEDQDIVRRLRRRGTFTVLRGKILASARAFVAHGVWRTHIVYYLLELGYLLGRPQRLLRARQRRLLGSAS